MGGRVWTLTQTDHALWYHTYKNMQDGRPKEEAGRKRMEEAGRKRKATGPLKEPITSKEKFRVKVEENPPPVLRVKVESDGDPELVSLHQVESDGDPELVSMHQVESDGDPELVSLHQVESDGDPELVSLHQVESDGDPELVSMHQVESDGDPELVSLLEDYFQLDVKLDDLYREWRAADPHFRSIADIFTGVRMLRQEPTECLFSFICTSNNHISRIQGMVERLCQALGGTALATLDGTGYYHFPSLEALAGPGVEACLRDLGFGYRARFLQQSAQNILQIHGGAPWLHNLRDVPYPEARDALRTLPGVGVKVADCVCLMSLDKAEAVPVDTHVWQIAKRDYSWSGGGGAKTLTPSVHREIGDFFRQLWGPYAGWAHSVLFCADLKKFQKMKESVSVKEEGSREQKREAGETIQKNMKREDKRTVKKERR